MSEEVASIHARLEFDASSVTAAAKAIEQAGKVMESALPAA